MLSNEALALFLRHADGRITVDDSNRDACRELAREGVLVVGHSFAAGREAFYVPTAMGRKLAEVMGHQRHHRPQNPPCPVRDRQPRLRAGLERGDVINMAALLPFVGDDRVDAVAGVRTFGQMRPPFSPFKRSGLSTPELTVMLPPSRPSGSKAHHFMCARRSSAPNLSSGMPSSCMRTAQYHSAGLPSTGKLLGMIGGVCGRFFGHEPMVVGSAPGREAGVPG